MCLSSVQSGVCACLLYKVVCFGTVQSSLSSVKSGMSSIQSGLSLVQSGLCVCLLYKVVCLVYKMVCLLYKVVCVCLLYKVVCLLYRVVCLVYKMDRRFVPTIPTDFFAYEEHNRFKFPYSSLISNCRWDLLHVQLEEVYSSDI